MIVYSASDQNVRYLHSMRISEDIMCRDGGLEVSDFCAACVLLQNLKDTNQNQKYLTVPWKEIGML